MSVVDILSTSANGSYNRKLAKITNLTVAVYCMELTDIGEKVKRKHTYDEQGWFTVDRGYIENQTTINLVDQLDCDAILANLGVLEFNPADKNIIRMDLRKLVDLLLDDKTRTVEAAKKKAKVGKSQSAANKTEFQIMGMKKLLRETDTTLYDAYCNWVDSVYASKGWLTKQKVYTFEDALNSYTSDSETKLKLLQIAIDTGYTNFDWIRDRYEGKRFTKSVSSLPEQKITTAVNTETGF